MIDDIWYDDLKDVAEIFVDYSTTIDATSLNLLQRSITLALYHIIYVW